MYSSPPISYYKWVAIDNGNKGKKWTWQQSKEQKNGMETTPNEEDDCTPKPQITIEISIIKVKWATFGACTL
jgi:hypothetical protein